MTAKHRARPDPHSHLEFRMIGKERMGLLKNNQKYRRFFIIINSVFVLLGVVISLSIFSRNEIVYEGEVGRGWCERFMRDNYNLYLDVEGEVFTRLIVGRAKCRRYADDLYGEKVVVGYFKEGGEGDCLP
ncbi:hypothetical protein [Alloalcanivorax xenomutans]|uniref:hypothetical protein n=1 Tax=Alloalcanivorax xenomutans TaxID=1094342 RepID=UPI0024E24B79|nr:hypothetical protein [Alloalcanivorax xenomutans]